MAGIVTANMVNNLLATFHKDISALLRRQSK